MNRLGIIDSLNFPKIIQNRYKNIILRNWIGQNVT